MCKLPAKVSILAVSIAPAIKGNIDLKESLDKSVLAKEKAPVKQKATILASMQLKVMLDGMPVSLVSTAVVKCPK